MNQEPVTVGGLSALELLGFGHYVVNESVTTHLYAHAKLSMWLNKLKSSVSFEWHGTKTLWSSEFLAEEKYVIDIPGEKIYPQ